jgi:DmsE family decaheme c-type cytochrome
MSSRRSGASVSLALSTLFLWWAPESWAAREGLEPLSTQGPTAEACIECHEAQALTIERTYHGTTENRCLECHSQGAAEHIQIARERQEAGPILAFSKLPSEEVNETCLRCHEKGKQANWTGGVHDRRDVSCLSCHSVHSFRSVEAQLKTARDAETCATCHPAIRAKSLRTSHHPVREGRIECASCHNPHDSTTPKMISASWVNEKCLECHTEKRGPFLWEHAPVRESCLTCHDPHGSNYDKMLVSKLPYLCQRCHMNTRHPGTLYDVRNAAAGPTPSNRAVEHACKNCHQNVHGSNHPSGPYLGR